MVADGKRISISAYFQGLKLNPAKYLVPRGRLELPHQLRHYPLKVACLPISPSGQGCDLAGARTQDPRLKRPLLYQLSYQVLWKPFYCGGYKETSKTSNFFVGFQVKMLIYHREPLKTSNFFVGFQVKVLIYHSKLRFSLVHPPRNHCF